MKRFAITLGGGALVLLAGGVLRPAFAQDETPAQESEPEVIPVKEEAAAPEPEQGGATQLDTIEVTANKRVKAQRDIPGSVNALRGELLEKINAQGMSDYLKRIPGVTLPEATADDKVPIIRGIATSLGTGGLSQLPTGIYAEEMPFTDVALPAVVPDMNPFDLERVEVLKGPQGTLYGSGALAGLIRYVLQKPKPLVWEGKLLTTLSQTRKSETPSWNAGAALNVPLFGDKFAVRAVGVYRDSAGLYDERARASEPEATGSAFNTTDFDSSQQTSGRLLAAWQFSDRLNLSGFYFQQETDVDDSSGGANNRNEPVRDPVPIGVGRTSGFSGTNLTAVYEFDFGTLMSSSNRITKLNRSGIGLLNAGVGTGVPEGPGDPGDDPTAPDGTEDVGAEDTDQGDLGGYSNVDVLGYTQEFRLSSPTGADGNWEWLTGASYQDFHNYLESQDDGVPFPGAADGFLPIGTPLGPVRGSRNFKATYIDYDLRSYEYSLFGEATRRLGEHWEVTAGMRAFEQGLTGDITIAGALAVALSGEIEAVQRSDYVERGLTPRFSVRYKHDRNMQAYALASRGYQFGGIQLTPPIVAIREAYQQVGGGGLVPYLSSDLWNYELGLRTEWLDRRLRCDLTLFYLDWTDLQVTVLVNVNQTGFMEEDFSVRFSVVDNVGKAHSEGAELSFEVVPFSGATFTSSTAWISALTDVVFETDAGTFPAGTRLPGSPRFQWSNVFSYGRALPYFESIEADFSLAHSFVGNYLSDIQGSTPAGDYSTLDANFGLRKSDSSWWLPQLTFNATNLTDVRAVSNSSDTGRVRNYRFIQPRTLMLTLGWRF